MAKQKVLAIVGPTGVGKTSLSITCARLFDGEVISGDSMQVYRGMDIGTAKIKDEEKQGIRHYLLDIQSYDQPFHVMAFQEKCRAAIESAASHHKLPIVCGGTGLYLKAALYDYEFEEQPGDKAYEKELEGMETSALYERLKQEDPASTKTIHPNNRKRIIRALQIARSGTTKSEREAAQRHEPLYDILWIGLDLERSRLMERIDERVEQMFAQGLVEEASRLFSDPKTWEYTSFQGIGYKEFKPYFLKEWSEEMVKEKIKIHTRQYAKRQMTWFNHQIPVRWFEKTDQDSILKTVKEWYDDKGD